MKKFQETWKNFIWFVWFYFNITDLFLSLFSPWRRDVVHRYWRGWHPEKSAQILIGNLFSRIMGAMVRIVVILIGLLAEVIVILGGLILLPLGVALLVLTNLSAKKKKSYTEMTLQELSEQKFFQRVWGRLGKMKTEIDNSIFSSREKLDNFLNKLKLKEIDFARIVEYEIALQARKERRKKFWLKENLEKKFPIGKFWKYSYTVNLDRVAEDITSSALMINYWEHLVGRKNEMELIKIILSRPSENCVLLVGESGVGKKSLIYHLASSIHRDNSRKNSNLKNKRVLFLKLGEAISMATERKENIENYLHLLFQEATRAGNVILIIENIDEYLKDNDKWNFSIAPIIAEYLSLPAFQVVATASASGYHKMIEHKENVMKSFSIVELAEVSEVDALKILWQKFQKMERRNVFFTYKSLLEIIKDSRRYAGEFPLPERAISLAMEVETFWQKENNERFITPKTVDRFLSLKTGVSMGEIGGEEKENLLNLEKILHQRIIKQDNAIKRVAGALRKFRLRVGDDSRPVGSFLFFGPTGVGKTETAKAVAEAYFGSEDKMIRLDMSEYQTVEAIEKLIGSKQNNQPGYLTARVKDNQFALLLLDEIEKAHPKVLDLFLQILDEGSLNDAFGKRVNFRNLIIIATSNAGANVISDMINEGKESDEIRKEAIKYIIHEGVLRTEFLNRFDDVIFFSPLEGEQIKSVAKLLLDKMINRLQLEKNIKIKFNQAVIEKICQQGYEPVFGARSLRRYIENKIEDIIITKIIAEDIKEGEEILLSENDIN